MTATIEAVPRRVTVELLSTGRELVHIVRVAILIVLGVWLYLASALGDASATRKNLLPYQTLVQSRPDQDQRMFRELQEGLLEAERIRSADGAWPTIPALVAEGIPPFAIDPTAKTAAFRWRLIRTGPIVNYLGIPDRPGVPAWLLLVQEPSPGVPPDQSFEDEEHNRLLDGTMLHVSTWSYADGAHVSGNVVRAPQAEGWTQIYAIGPGRLSKP
jgi:hypothetical protein